MWQKGEDHGGKAAAENLKLWTIMIIFFHFVTHDQAVRSTQCLEAPVVYDGSILVSSEVSVSCCSLTQK